MNQLAKWLVATVALVGGVTWAAPAPVPTTAPVEWGEVRSGLQMAVLPVGEVTVGKPFTLLCRVRNTSPQPVPAGKGFGWVLLVQGKDRAVYSDKLTLDVPEVAPDKTVELKIDLGDQKTFVYHKGMKLSGGYPTMAPGEGETEAAGPVDQVLTSGRTKIRWMLGLSLHGEPVLLSSGVTDLVVLPPDITKLTPEARKAFVADLVTHFRADAFAAMAAHHQAVRVGPAIVPDLLAALDQGEWPDYGKMWLVTAVIDLGDPRAVDPLLAMLKGGDKGITYIVAYHGPKMKSDPLNSAILAKAQSDDDPVFTAWAARGFAARSLPVADKLIEAALKSTEPRARAEVAEALAKKPDEKNIARLVVLLKDDSELVRVGAARAVGGAVVKSPAIRQALVASLDLKGESARQAVCAALSKIVGKDLAYDPEADDAAKQQVIAKWKELAK